MEKIQELETKVKMKPLKNPSRLYWSVKMEAWRNYNLFFLLHKVLQQISMKKSTADYEV